MRFDGNFRRTLASDAQRGDINMLALCLGVTPLLVGAALLSAIIAFAGAGDHRVRSPDGRTSQREVRVLTSIAAPSPVVAAPGEGILRPVSNRAEVDPMIALEGAPFFPSRAMTAGGDLTPDMFTEPESCAECHTEIYEDWSHSIMGHSWTDPIYRALLKAASVATEGAVDNFCIGCHSPIGLVTGTADAVEGDLGGVVCQSVSCDSCHTMSSVTGAGNGSYVLEPVSFGRPVKYGPREDALSPFHDTTRSELHTKSEFCASCHNVTHPFNRLPVERTYDEWRDSPYNSKGISCMDCHMTPEPGIAMKPGRSAPDGKEREGVFAHTFAGANVTLHEYFGEEDSAARARKMLESAATIEFLDVPETLVPGKRVTVAMRVTNVGAGHKLPTGFPEGREVWIDFKVCDAEGNEIYRLGKIEHGRTEPGTRNFKATLGDAEGNIVDYKVWEAERVLSDTRLLPLGWADVDFTFPIPEDAIGPLELVADLNYTSFPQHILDALMGDEALESQIVLMTSVRESVELGPASSEPQHEEPEHGKLRIGKSGLDK